MASRDPRIIACTAAMEGGTRLSEFRSAFSSRFFDVGIAEGHMLTYAAGLAAGGMRPVVCVYSTFLQRAMDQLVHDICMQRHPVLLAVDRAGLNGEDGETHQGLFDIAWGRSIPGLAIGAPRDVADLEFMMSGWLERSVPMMIRYPKGAAPRSISRDGGFAPAQWGKAEVLMQGEEVCLIGLGSVIQPALDAAVKVESRGLPRPTVIDLRFISPMDWDAVDGAISSHSLIVPIEDGYISGGAGEAIAARASISASSCRVCPLGVDMKYVAHSTRAQQMKDFGLTGEGIADAIVEFYGKESAAS
jgi:1-deoxy-D-xylulose-5-phosphate synthase